MDVTTALLCDFAQVREGLLFVSSGLITRVVAESFPALVPVHLALVVELGPEEVGLAHEVRLTALRSRDGEVLARMVQAMQPSSEALLPGETLQIPFVAVFRLGAEEPGPYDIRVVADSSPARLLRFYVVGADQ